MNKELQVLIITVLARNLLPNGACRIGRYETPSLHTAIEWEARLVTAVGRLGSDPNGALA